MRTKDYNRTSGTRSVRREQHTLRNQFLIGIVTIFLIFTCCVLFGNILSSAQDSTTQRSSYSYESITIKTGDTLWSIAEEYMTDQFDTVPEYVAELKRVNSLVSDDIQSGSKLIVSVQD